MISGLQLREGIIAAGNDLNAKKDEIDRLNVFPVPDGDTGTNMALTMAAAVAQVGSLPEGAGVGTVAEVAAKALLRGARGNSGVILSLIFRGFARGLEGCEYANGVTLAAALSQGSAAAYEAVSKPCEGTILTVIRLAAEEAERASGETHSPKRVFEAAVRSGKRALANTPNLLPVLKKAKVVDAGGQGLVYVLEGMLRGFSGGESSLTNSVPNKATASYEGELQFKYCTEFLIEKNNPTDKARAKRLKVFFEKIGDCAVAVDDGDIIKVHLHTNRPGEAITKALEIGELDSIKIDNMSRQHRETLTLDESRTQKISLAAVCSGSGIGEAFRQGGAEVIIEGGQTANPSVESILKGIDEAEGDSVFLLPNNENIIMAARQAGELSQKKVEVVPTTTIPQGIAALLAFDENASAEENLQLMEKAAKKVVTLMVSYAAREAAVGGERVKKGDILAIEGGRLVGIDTDPVKAAFNGVKKLAKKSTSLVTVFYGEGVREEQAVELCRMLEQRLPGEAEIVIVNGGQPVYYYIISIE